MRGIASWPPWVGGTLEKVQRIFGYAGTLSRLAAVLSGKSHAKQRIG
jgi:hypothetical protein